MLVGTRRAAIGILLSAATLWASAAQAVEVNRIVLRVNDRIATLYDYEERKQERLTALARSSLSEAEKQQQLAGLGESVMRDMYDELLLLSRADQLAFRAEESDIAAMMQQTKEGFGITSDEEFEQALASNGMTREGFRRQIERNLLIRQTLGREVYSKISVGDEDVRNYYRQNPADFTRPAKRRLREVVVLESAGDAETLAQVAADLQREIVAGNGEEAVPTRREDGLSTGWIELGWVEVGDLDPELERALAELGAGEVSAPTAARGGLHIIEVMELEEETLVDFSEVSDAIRARLRDERFAQQLDGYMSELEETAYVESDPPPDAAGFRSRATAPRARIDPLEQQMAAQKARQESAPREQGEAAADGGGESSPSPPPDRSP